MLRITNINKIARTASYILPPGLKLYSRFETHEAYIFGFAYSSQYPKDIVVELEKERNPLLIEKNYKLTVRGNSHTLWNNNGTPIKTNVYPLIIERYVSKDSLKSLTGFLEGITEIILSNFDDPGFNM